MPFINPAGPVLFRAFVPSSTNAGLPEAYSVPLVGTTSSCRSQASWISNGMCDATTERNRIELERTVRQRNAECEFRGMLTNLKDRLASKVAARTGASAPAEVFYRAS